MNVKFGVTNPKFTKAAAEAREFHDSRDAYKIAESEHIAAGAQLKAGLISWAAYDVAMNKAAEANKRWNAAGMPAWHSLQAGCLKEL